MSVNSYSPDKLYRQTLQGGGWIVEKCRLCEREVFGRSVPCLETALAEMTDGRPRRMWGRPKTKLAMTSYHYCDDGRVGITDVVGVKPDWMNDYRYRDMTPKEYQANAETEGKGGGE